MKKNKKTSGEIYSNSTADGLSSVYGIDISDKLSTMISDELTKSINSDILETLQNLGLQERRKNSIRKIYGFLKN